MRNTRRSNFGDDWNPGEALFGAIYGRFAECITYQYHHGVKLSKALRSLLPREERVIRMRFGFYSYGAPSSSPRPLMLKQVGAVLGLTHQRISQIQGKALRKLRKLRHPSRSVLNSTEKRAFEDSFEKWKASL